PDPAPTTPQHRTGVRQQRPEVRKRPTALRQADQGKKDGKPMTNCPDDTALADDVPAADAAEQHQPAADSADDAGLDPREVASADDAGLDPREVANLLQRDANPSDVIDQAIIVPLPDDDRDDD